MNAYAIQDIFFSCTEAAEFVAEHFVPEHGLAHVLSGEMRVSGTDSAFAVTRGQTVLFGRNQLVKIVKYPEQEVPFRAVSLLFNQSFLSAYYASHTARKDGGRRECAVFLSSTPLLESLFTSLLPYEGLKDPLPEELISLKLAEALTIARPLHPAVDGLLSDFSVPGKIDLAEFMHKNFSFNIGLERFAYLTGRSLATFKRDFRKIFQTSPQKWLLERRLRQAHFLIAERNVRPSEAYIEVGFENLSHFSAAFKDLFGYNASSLIR